MTALKALYACITLGIFLITLSITSIFILGTIKQEPLIIRDTIGNAQILYQVDRSQVVLPYECVNFEWQLDGIDSTYFNDEPATGYSGEELCITPNDGVLSVNFQDETTQDYVIPITVMYSQVRFWILSSGLFLVFTGLAILPFVDRVTAETSHKQVWLILGILGIIIVGFLLRILTVTSLDYSFGYESIGWLNSRVQPGYNFACTYLSPICNPITSPPQTIQALLVDSLHTRTGLPLTITGLIAGFLPLNLISSDTMQLLTYSAQIVHFIVDIIIAIIIVSTLRRLRFPNWVALLGGYIFIFFIPIIIESATILREPISRLGFMMALSAYIFAFSETKRRLLVSMILIGTIGTVILGFASPPNHIAMWVIFVTVSMIFLFHQYRWSAIGTQLFLIIVLLFSLNQYAGYVSNNRNIPKPEVMSLFLSGISSDGTVSQLTTVTTCNLIWCTEGETTTVNESITQSIFSDPIEFTQRYIYSLFGNVTGANNVYQQDYLLNYKDQIVQQKLVVLLGLLGIAWLLGNIRIYWKEISIVALPTMYFIAIFSLNGIETRRLTGVLQVFILASPIYSYSLVTLFHNRRRDFWKMLIVIISTILIWWIPVDILASVLPMRSAANILLLAHVMSGIGLIICHILIWSKQQENFNRWLPTSFLLLALIVIAYGDINEVDEYEWRVNINETIQQTVSDINIEEQHWLLIDLSSNQEAESIEISVNNIIVKQAGVPMGLYIQDSILVSRHVTRFNYESLRLWYAFPLSIDFLETNAQSGSLDITLRSSESIDLYGNYLVNNQTYIGPGIQPVSDISFAYLLYTLDDARVTSEFDVSNISSQRFIDGNEVTDLSSYFGQQTGIYRIFVVPDNEDIELQIVR